MHITSGLTYSLILNSIVQIFYYILKSLKSLTQVKIMVELNDIAKENSIDLNECIVFVRGEDDILAVDSTHAGIKQRSDDTMAFKFSLLPKDALKLEKYFENFTSGEKFFYDITQSGYRPAYYRGLSPMTKEISLEEEAKFNITLYAEKAMAEADDSYFAPTCEGCEFCMVGFESLLENLK